MRLSWTVALVLLALPGAAQERRPVPADSLRISVAGCSKGYVFTTSGRADDQPADSGVPDGTHLRLSGPKKLVNEIRALEGQRIEITGLVRKGQVGRDGIGIGFGGGRLSGGPPVAGGLAPPAIGASQPVIDVEGWRSISGPCVVR